MNSGSDGMMRSMMLFHFAELSLWCPKADLMQQERDKKMCFILKMCSLAKIIARIAAIQDNKQKDVSINLISMDLSYLKETCWSIS